MRDYTAALELNPDFTQAYNNRGISFRHLGQLENSIADYNRSIEMKPEYETAINNRQEVLDHRTNIVLLKKSSYYEYLKFLLNKEHKGKE